MELRLTDSWAWMRSTSIAMRLAGFRHSAKSSWESARGIAFGYVLQPEWRKSSSRRLVTQSDPVEPLAGGAISRVSDLGAASGRCDELAKFLPLVEAFAVFD